MVNLDSDVQLREAAWHLREIVDEQDRVGQLLVLVDRFHLRCLPVHQQRHGERVTEAIFHLVFFYPDLRVYLADKDAALYGAPSADGLTLHQDTELLLQEHRLDELLDDRDPAATAHDLHLIYVYPQLLKVEADALQHFCDLV